MRCRKISCQCAVLFICCMFLTACTYVLPKDKVQIGQEITNLKDIPDYSGVPYTEINGNVPQFSEDELTENSFETYSNLDSLQRCGTACANIGTDLMPVEERGGIGQIKPSGWHTVKYDNVDGKYLYNRCHLIGYQLSGENANEKNLITGTRYMNVEGMLPFENLVADYVKETANHVLYRVTPVFEGNNLLAKGVHMEALSVEDQGEGISYNVFVYNVQPGVYIDYLTGESSLEKADIEQTQNRIEGEIRGNARSKIYHCPGQAAYDKMADSKYLVIFKSEQEAEDEGYRKAKR
ncbi:hypothetical protein D3Z36_02190 [Lachnospiraceae bacterium]|nr:hypothetical protein [Lachnospiraceae bacterium]